MNTKLKKLKVTFEGHVYNYGKLASVVEDVIEIEVASDDIEVIQAEIEKQYGHTYGSFYLHLVEDVTNYTPTFIISPRDVKTSSNDRHIVRQALSALIEKHGRRLNRLTKEDKIEEAADIIAHARDLLTRFAEGGE